MNELLAKDSGITAVCLGLDYGFSRIWGFVYGNWEEKRDDYKISVIDPTAPISSSQWRIFSEMIKEIEVCFLWILGNQIWHWKMDSISETGRISLIDRFGLMGRHLRIEFENADPVISAVWCREYLWLMQDLGCRKGGLEPYKEGWWRISSTIIYRLFLLFQLYITFCERERLAIKISQSAMLLKEDSGKKVAVVSNRLKISVPHFDNTELIRGYAKTLIGRCMNPRMQDVKSLLYMLPKIWKIEERVAGADLGMGRFQLDFDSEEDIEAVLKMGPFHFDYWMLSLVRWEPIVDQRYPYSITFWVRAMGVPLHFWAVPTFMSIGDGIGEAKEVDLDNGKVKVVIDGFKPLIFETVVSFYNGEETLVSLRYERLHGYCRLCFSLCHDAEMCPSKEKPGEKEDKSKRQPEEQGRGQNVGRRSVSYRGVVINGNERDKMAKDNHGRVSESHNKGKAKLNGEWIPPLNNHRLEYRRSYKPHERRLGESSSSQSHSKHRSPRDKHTMAIDGQEGFQQAKESTGDQPLTKQEKQLLDTLLAKATKQDLPQTIEEPNGQGVNARRSPKKVCKALTFDRKMSDLEEEPPVEGILAQDLDSSLLLAEDGMDVWDQMVEAEDIAAETKVVALVNNTSMVTMEDTSEKPEITREEVKGDNEEKKLGGKKKTVPVNHIFVGRLSKKRLVQNMISPRKKGAMKFGVRTGKENGSGEGKNEVNPQMETNGFDEATT